MLGGPVGLQRHEIVAAVRADLLRDFDLSSHGVDGDEGAGELEPFEQQRNGDDFVGLLVHSLLTHDEELARRAGGNHVQWPAAPGVGMASPRGLAADGDNVRIGLAQRLDPVGE